MSSLLALLRAAVNETDVLDTSRVQELLFQRDCLFQNFLAGQLPRVEFLRRWGDLCCRLQLGDYHRTQILSLDDFAGIYRHYLWQQKRTVPRELEAAAIVCLEKLSLLLKILGSSATAMIGCYLTDDGECLPVVLPVLLTGTKTCDVMPTTVFAELDNVKLQQLVATLQEIYAAG